MADTASMLKTHPSPSGSVDKLAACIDACRACLVSCNACADACLAGPDPKKMAHCIRTDLDCAAICAATVAVLCRQTEPSGALLRAQVQAMVAACKACGESCMAHADQHEHCKLCGETCRDCERKCSDLLSALPAA